jgi:hypothetical protein
VLDAHRLLARLLRHLEAGRDERPDEFLDVAAQLLGQHADLAGVRAGAGLLQQRAHRS